MADVRALSNRRGCNYDVTNLLKQHNSLGTSRRYRPRDVFVVCPVNQRDEKCPNDGRGQNRKCWHRSKRICKQTVGECVGVGGGGFLLLFSVCH